MSDMFGMYGAQQIASGDDVSLEGVAKPAEARVSAKWRIAFSDVPRSVLAPPTPPTKCS